MNTTAILIFSFTILGLLFLTFFGIMGVDGESSKKTVLLLIVAFLVIVVISANVGMIYKDRKRLK